MRVVGAALDSGAERGGWGRGWGSLSQPLLGNWHQMWGSMAPAPARRQGRIKSSAQRDELTPKTQAEPHTALLTTGPPSVSTHPHLFNPCSSSAKITKHCLKTSQLCPPPPCLFHSWPWFLHWQYEIAAIIPPRLIMSRWLWWQQSWSQVYFMSLCCFYCVHPDCGLTGDECVRQFFPINAVLRVSIQDSNTFATHNG